MEHTLRAPHPSAQVIYLQYKGGNVYSGGVCTFSNAFLGILYKSLMYIPLKF
jgi:hypothetical protein